MVKAKIMVVEDEYIVAMYMKTLLEKMEYAVTSVQTSGEAAISAVSGDAPDMILMDIALEGELDGIQSAELIRKKMNVPIIFSTAYTDDDMLRRAKLIEPAGYLLKPLDPRQLSITIEMALHKAEVEERLRQSEKRFRQMVEASPFPISIIDGNERLTYLNRKFMDVFGYTLEDIPTVADWHRHFFPDPDQRAEVTAMWQKDLHASRDRELSPRELEVRCKHGMARSVLFRIVHMDGGRHMVTCEDITHRKQISEELLKTKKLEAVGILAGGIAHDFNNLLSVILGNINLCQIQAEPETKLARWLSEAEKASMRAKNLTQKFTTFASGGKPVKKVTSLVNVVENAVSLAISGSSVVCEYDFSPGLLQVEIDPEQMNQVINHLVLNAIAAMPQGGTLRISAENLTVTDTPSDEPTSVRPGQYVRITIRDEGTGIAPEHLSAIFDPYFSTKKRGSQKGMGFGLPISHSIIRHHGGYIFVSSEPEKGTTAEIYLPAVVREDRPPAPAPDQPAGEASRRILVMDDEEMIRDLVSQMLEHIGYAVVAAAHGEEAIERYETARTNGAPFDVVILDLTVPGGMGGRETLQNLLKIDPDVQAIVSSGYSTDAIISHYDQWGFVERIAKPYQLKELDVLLRKVLRK